MRAYQLCVALGFMGILASCSSSDKDLKVSIQTAEIVSFTANPDEVLEGDPTILSWEVRNAVGVLLKDQQGKVLVTSDAKEGTFTVIPDRATLYALVARGKNGKEIEKQVAVRIRPGAGPEASFAIEPPVVPIGNTVRLVWETSDATEVVIRSGEKVVFESNRKLSGSIELIAEGPAIYTLTAVGRWGHRVVPAEVKVTPVILSFDAGKGEPVQKGSEAGVSWRTRGAQELTIRTPEGQSWNIDGDKVDAGSVVLPVGESGRFELIARRGEHQVTQVVDVPLLGAPAIRSLTVSKGTITDAEPTRLTVSWQVDNGHEGELVWGTNRRRIGWLELRKGSYDLELAAATDITLTTRNEVAGSSSTVRVGTIPAPVPTLSGPIHVGPREEFVLGWNAPGAERIKLFRNDEELDVPEDRISGTITESVTQRTVYRLEAWNDVGSLRTGSRTVILAAPQVLALKSDRVRYGSGAPMVFSWTATGGTSLQIYDDEGEPIPGCSLAEGGGIEGSCTVAAPVEFGSYTYVLEAANGVGRVSRPLSFRVGDGPAIDLFEADRQFVSAGKPLTLRWLVLDDVDGTPATVTITDNRGGSWQFNGTHLEPGSLSLVAGAPGDWRFTLVASVPGKEPVEAERAVTIEALPELYVEASSLQYNIEVRDPIVLEWTTVHASKVEIFALDAQGVRVNPPVFRSGSAADAAQGSMQIRPTWPGQSFEVVAYNHSGDTDRARFDFEVLGDPRGVRQFTVSATTVPRGSPVTLQWNTAGQATLAPFYDAPIEVTTTAPFEDVHATGTVMAMTSCGSSISSDDEGCNIVSFPNGFTFPFDGAALAGVTAFVNSHASAELRTNFGSTWSGISKYPSSSYPFSNFGILWKDNFLAGSDQTIRHQLKDGPRGRYMVVQWTNTTDGTFQIVFWESGGLDYRYRTAGTGSSSTIGWQFSDRALSHNLNGDRAAVSGGLSNRSWRYFEKPQADTGSLTVTVNRTTIFTLCGVGPLGRQCERRTVTVQ